MDGTGPVHLTQAAEHVGDVLQGVPEAPELHADAQGVLAAKIMEDLLGVLNVFDLGEEMCFFHGFMQIQLGSQIGFSQIGSGWISRQKNGLVQLVAPPLIDHLWKEFGCNSIILATSLLWLELN